MRHQFGFWGAVILVWFAVTELALVDQLILPSPVDLLHTLGQATFLKQLFWDAGFTLYRVLAAFALSVVVAVPLGLLIGSISLLGKLLDAPIDFLRSIPVAALFPLFLIVFGIGESSKLAAAAWSSGLIILVSTILGIRSANKFRQEVLKVYGASFFQILLCVRLPDALVQIIVGLRVAVSTALIVVVMTEMFFGASDGLGYQIYNAAQLYRMPEMYIGILTTGILGFLINNVLEAADKKLIHWRGMA